METKIIKDIICTEETEEKIIKEVELQILLAIEKYLTENHIDNGNISTIKNNFFDQKRCVGHYTITNLIRLEISIYK